ncbi:MAG: 1-acyl-sn-glycerol-3-phosphate acyltransferase [Bacilli bacterium]|nr:1-acyl-sn-glycerol-3-phosphate acyltransferase [Bacilli bacterium]
MAFGLILILIASILSGLTFYYGGFYQSVSWLWLPFILALVYFWGLFLVYALCLAAYGQALKRHPEKTFPPTRFPQWLLSETCYVLFWLFRVRFHASGVGKIPSPKTTFMIVSNHLSGFDHVGLASLFVRHRFVCVTKQANADVIAAGGLIRRAGYLSIVQGDILSGTKVIEKAGAYIRDNVASVCIAPEGTRNKDFPNPTVLPFHPGSFQMAYIAQCPIVVFAIQNTNAILRRYPFRWTDVYFDCVGVLEYEEYKDLSPAQLAEKTRNMILRRFEQKEARFYHLPPKKQKEKDESHGD